MDIKEANKKLQMINRGLFIDVKTNELGKYYCIKYKDDRTGLTREVFNVLSDTGEPKPLDLEEIRKVATEINWPMVAKYPEPKALADAFLNEREVQKKKAKLERQGYILDMNKDRRRQWAVAFEEFKNSLTPQQVKKMKLEQERKEFYHPKKIII
jgi:hypothetical protein